jgi:hypothetical protein
MEKPRATGMEISIDSRDIMEIEQLVERPSK